MMSEFGRGLGPRPGGGPDHRGTRFGGAGASGALGLLGAVVAIVTALIAVIILLGILFVVLEANMDNGIVSTVNDVADFFVGPFDRMFTPESRKLEISVNWGIATAFYVIVGGLIASLLRSRR